MTPSMIVAAGSDPVRTRRCLEAVDAATDTPAHRLVVGPAAAGAVRDMGGGNWTPLDSRGGAAAAWNQGARAADEGPLVFVDAAIEPVTGWLSSLVRRAAEGGAAAIGPRALYCDETTAHAGVAFGQGGFPRWLYAGFPADHPAVNRSRRVQAVAGGCLLVLRDAFEEVGPFDADLDGDPALVDLCLALGQARLAVEVCGGATVYVTDHTLPDLHSSATMRHRWGGRVAVDEVSHYLDDELITVRHRGSYPLELTVSPLLGWVDREEADRATVRLLAERSRQVHELMAEVVRLTRLVRQELLPSASAGVDGADPVPVEVGGAPANPESDGKAAAAQELDAADTGRLWGDLRVQLMRREREIGAEILELQEQLAGALEDPELFHASGALESFVPSRYLGYDQMTRRAHVAARTALPEGATVLVVAKGDDRMVDIEGLNGWHFPRGEDGWFSHYPAEDGEAVAQLEALRADGAEYLLFPATSLWWLDYYEDFARHLNRRYRLVVREEDTCFIYALRSDPPQRPDVAGPRIRELIAALLPQDAVVAVAAGGNRSLLRLGGPAAWHFPPDDGAGGDPRDADEAMAQLEALRSRGAAYLLVPSGGLFDRVPQLRRRIEARFPLALRREDLCLIYDLAGSAAGDGSGSTS